MNSLTDAMCLLHACNANGKATKTKDKEEHESLRVISLLVEWCWKRTYVSERQLLCQVLTLSLRLDYTTGHEEHS